MLPAACFGGAGGWGAAAKYIQQALAAGERRLRNTYSKRSQQANAVRDQKHKKVHTDPHRPTGCLINQPADRPIE